MRRESNTNTVAATQDTSSTILPDWMKFPTLAEVFDQSLSETIAHMTAKEKEYQSREAMGTASDRVQGRLIAAGYARTCALLQELDATRAELGKKGETKSV